MKAEDFFGFFPESRHFFLEGQKGFDYPKLEVLRREVSGYPGVQTGNSAGLYLSREIAWSGENT